MPPRSRMTRRPPLRHADAKRIEIPISPAQHQHFQELLVAHQVAQQRYHDALAALALKGVTREQLATVKWTMTPTALILELPTSTNAAPSQSSNGAG